MKRLFDLFRRPFAAPAEARVPDGLRVYAIGDIHGCREELDRLLERVEADLSGHEGASRLVFLGDYVDRGPDSAGVIERLAGGGLPGDGQTFLRGNHEMVFADLLRGEREAQSGWLAYGGFATLASYGIERAQLFDGEPDVPALLGAAVPEHHRRFLHGLEPSVRLGDYFFAHAGVRPGVALAEQSERDLAWIRESFLGSREDHGAVIVHGHTISDDPEVRPNRVGIDTGCYRTGRLTALVLEGAGRRFLTS